MAADTPPALLAGSTWRCGAGKVHAGAVGANHPCAHRADTRRAPTEAMAAFCRGAPAGAAIMLVVTGRATVCAWRGADGVPAIERRITAPDARACLAAIAHEIRSPRK